MKVAPCSPPRNPQALPCTPLSGGCAEAGVTGVFAEEEVQTAVSSPSLSSRLGWSSRRHSAAPEPASDCVTRECEPDLVLPTAEPSDHFCVLGLGVISAVTMAHWSLLPHGVFSPVTTIITPTLVRLLWSVINPI